MLLALVLRNVADVLADFVITALPSIRSTLLLGYSSWTAPVLGVIARPRLYRLR
jgi:hypothetical protein